MYFTIDGAVHPTTVKAIATITGWWITYSGNAASFPHAPSRADRLPVPSPVDGASRIGRCAKPRIATSHTHPVTPNVARKSMLTPS